MLDEMWISVKQVHPLTDCCITRGTMTSKAFVRAPDQAYTLLVTHTTVGVTVVGLTNNLPVRMWSLRKELPRLVVSQVISRVYKVF